MVASLRKESLSRIFANYIVSEFPNNVTVTEIDLDQPNFNEDIDGPDAPEGYKKLRQQIRDSDCVLMVVPEYNYGMPGYLKNVLDIASRPHDDSCLEDKKLPLQRHRLVTKGVDLRL